MPASLFAFTLGADTLGVARNTYRHPERGWLVDTIVEMPELPASARSVQLLDYSATERRWIADTLTSVIRGRWRDDWRFGLLLGGPAGGRDYVLAYTIMRTGWGDTIVYGSEYPRETIARLFGDILHEEGLLPEPFTRDHGNAELLTVEVADAANRPLYRSMPEPDWTLEATTPLPDFLGGLRIRTEIRPELAAEMVIGGLPRSRLPFLLALLGIAATLAVVAVRQLRREQELAQLRGDFVASVSHELRTPLAQIRLFLETLRLGRATTDAQREWSLGNIDRETTRLAHLVDNVLQFSRGGPRRAPRLQPADLTREVRQTVEAFEPLARARRVRLRLLLEDDVAALIDSEWFRQVLTNVLDNAVKYGPAGQTVTVALDRSDDRAILSVQDEGPGVREEDLDVIWQPFFRGEAARASAAGGSGIGLSIVRELTEAQGGTATVEGGGGSGAKFIIALRAIGAARPSRARAASSGPE
jgi:signal transduction histidine kinase